MSKNELEQGREQWGTRIGFILAALGSAVGLGNIWRFSYIAGESGGAAFLIIYLLAIAFIGFPIMMCEFMIGRRAQSDAVQSFHIIAPGKPWFIAGGVGVAAGFIILSFYAVVAGWTLKYLFSYITGGLWSTPSDGYESYFTSFISNTQPIIWQFIIMALTVGIVVLGVKKGIEKANKIMMPLLGIILLLLAGYSLTLGGAKAGLTFLFSPDWEAFRNPNVYLTALGQAFFSLSLGMAALITYSSYLPRKEKLPSAATSIIILDTLFAVIAGIMIFPAVFAFNAAPDAGPGLVFITMPEVFGQIGGFGIVIGILFFLLLTAAAISSAVSMLEVCVAYFMRKFSLSRKPTTILIGALIFIIGLPSALSATADAPLGGIHFLGDRGFFDSADFLTSNIMLPLGGLLIALFVGWTWEKSEMMRESDFRSSQFGSIFRWILILLVPIAILAVFVNSIG